MHKIIENGRSEYFLVGSEFSDECERYAASELQKYIYRSTDVLIPYFAQRCEKRGKEILIGNGTRDVFLSSEELEAIAEEGFIVKSVGEDILIAGKHGGVILPFCGDDGVPLYASKVANAAGMAVSAAAPSLPDDVARVSRRGLNVTVVYTVTCFSTPDAAVAAYRRGLDLALLLECAEARPHDILLLGLPSGKDVNDRRAAEFLTELSELLEGLPARPAIGVALPPSAFAARSDSGDETDTDTPLYAGTLSPARLLTFCDYLAMDLRAMSAVGVTTLLPDIRYAYTRYSLRLLVNVTDREAVDTALNAGYGRIFEMDPPPAANGGEETEQD